MVQRRKWGSFPLTDNHNPFTMKKLLIKTSVRKRAATKIVNQTANGSYRKLALFFLPLMTSLTSNTISSKWPMISTSPPNCRQMMIVRDLDNVVTVKSIKGHSVGCLFKLCFPLGWDRSVYQLERSFSGKGSRVRITLVAGVTAPSK